MEGKEDDQMTKEEAQKEMRKVRKELAGELEGWSTFLDGYFQRESEGKSLTEEEVDELMTAYEDMAPDIEEFVKGMDGYFNRYWRSRLVLEERGESKSEEITK